MIGVLLEIVFAFITIAVFLYWLFYSSINSNRYWGQIYELMCDRKACELNGVTVEGMKSLVEYLYNNFKEFNKYKWYFKYYYKYFVVLEHPCLKYRLKQIRNYKKWCIFDYFKQPLVIVCWLLTGRGWIGE